LNADKMGEKIDQTWYQELFFFIYSTTAIATTDSCHSTSPSCSTTIRVWGFWWRWGTVELFSVYLP